MNVIPFPRAKTAPEDAALLPSPVGAHVLELAEALWQDAARVVHYFQPDTARAIARLPAKHFGGIMWDFWIALSVFTRHYGSEGTARRYGIPLPLVQAWAEGMAELRGKSRQSR